MVMKTMKTFCGGVAWNGINPKLPNDRSDRLIYFSRGTSHATAPPPSPFPLAISLLFQSIDSRTRHPYSAANLENPKYWLYSRGVEEPRSLFSSDGSISWPGLLAPGRCVCMRLFPRGRSPPEGRPIMPMSLMVSGWCFGSLVRDVKGSWWVMARIGRGIKWEEFRSGCGGVFEVKVVDVRSGGGLC